jgi:membrane associated rhomboid family serine protease
MLLPIKHENMTVRRWPVITLGLILVNFLVFLCTYRAMDRQDNALWPVELHLLVLSARHPELTLPPKAHQFVADFQVADPAVWEDLQNLDSKAVDDWDTRMRSVDDPEQLQTEMDSLATEYSSLTAFSITQQYAFIPAHPRPIAYISSNFLHGGWSHLVFNMWFLWLAGFVLEDVWGRPLYLIFYLVAGAVSMQLDGWANPGSIIPSLGASGAIAGLMGAFLVRFPKLKIRLMWLFGSWLSAFFRIWVRAYWLLPVWFGMEIYYGKVSGHSDGIAHWAHVGGFAFGALAALAIRHSGLERNATKAIEEKVSWTPDPEITRAIDLMERGKLDEAAAILYAYVSRNPNSFEAWSSLRLIHWRRDEIWACREVTTRLCTMNLKAGRYEAAWQDYDEFLNMGGDRMPPAIWLELCRVPEERNDYRRALSEYEKLAAAYPAERPGLMAQLGAARILLKRLDRPRDALRFYEAASASAVPHLDCERDIQLGIKEAKTTLSQRALMVT